MSRCSRSNSHYAQDGDVEVLVPTVYGLEATR